MHRTSPITIHRQYVWSVRDLRPALQPNVLIKSISGSGDRVYLKLYGSWWWTTVGADVSELKRLLGNLSLDVESLAGKRTDIQFGVTDGICAIKDIDYHDKNRVRRVIENYPEF